MSSFCLRSKFSTKVCFLFSKNTSTHRFESEAFGEQGWNNFQVNQDGVISEKYPA